MILALRGSLFGWVGRGILTGVLMALVHRRLGEISAAMERMVARFAAGKLRQVAHRAAPAGPWATPGRVAAMRFWPREIGWLTDLMKHHAAVYTARLEIVLVEPQMAALLAASPAARRLVRPMCRMLAVHASVLRPVVLGEIAVVVPRVRKLRVRKVREVVEHLRPLQPWVLAAARVWKKRDGE